MLFLYYMYVLLYYIFFKFGENIFRSSARGECPACEIFKFENLYLAEAPAGNYPPAKYWIPIFYICIGREKSITRQRQKQQIFVWNILYKGSPNMPAGANIFKKMSPKRLLITFW